MFFLFDNASTIGALFYNEENGGMDEV